MGVRDSKTPNIKNRNIINVELSFVKTSTIFAEFDSSNRLFSFVKKLGSGTFSSNSFSTGL